MTRSTQDTPIQRPIAWFWWTVLILVVSLIFAMRFVEKAPAAAPPDPAKVASPVLRIYGRYLIGANVFFNRTAGSPSGEAAAVLDSLDESAHSIVERIRVVPIAAELAGPVAALERLEKIEAELESDATLDDGFRRDAEALRALYESPADQPAVLEPAVRDELVQRHDWFARLALSWGLPDTDPARRTFLEEGRRVMVTMLAALAVLMGSVLAGFVLFIIAIILVGSREIRSAIAASLRHERDGTAPASNALLESVVIFLLAFIAMSILGEIASMLTGLDLTFVLAWPLVLLALWPLTRGVPMGRLRAALGWHSGRGIFREIGAGIVGHIAGIPIVLFGLLLSILIVSLTGTDASHPISNEVNTTSPFAIAGLFLMTSVWAPLVEETFFRGALYGHLRGFLSFGSPRRTGDTAPGDSSLFPASRPPPLVLARDTATPTDDQAIRVAPPPARLRLGLSAIPAALVTGFVFAAIHPQGFGGIPVLTALGVNFCLMREWRGSLIAPMTAHALHNGAITLLLVFLLS